MAITGYYCWEIIYNNIIHFDQELDVNNLNVWKLYEENLKFLEDIRIPRWIKTHVNFLVQLHGFADASEKAHAAVVYAKVEESVTLIASKSKVNPKKNRQTIPKLELCAAHLLSKLMQRTKESNSNIAESLAWSDSTITLAWIRNGNCKDKFIRRRSDDIKKLMDTEWSDVKSEDNRADIASRGICATKLKDCSIWWNGPKWLSMSKDHWPKFQLVQKEEIFVSAVITSTETTYLNYLKDIQVFKN